MMKKQLYSQQNSIEVNGKPRQFISPIYTIESEEGNEGGLNLGELLKVIRRRILVIVIGTTTVASAAIGFAVASTPTYVAKFELLTEPVTAEDKVTPDDKYKRDETSNRVDENKVKILQSPKLMSPITEQVRMYYPDSSPPQLDIKLLPNTQILEVSYKDSNPDKVLFVLNTAAQAYLKYSLEERQTDTNLAIKFVEKQLPQLLKRVELIQSRLQAFRQKYGIINAEAQSQQLASQVDQIVQKRLETETELARTQTLYMSIQKQLRLEPNEAEAILALSDSSGYQKLLNQLQDVESKIATRSSQYTEDNPTIQNLLIQKQNLLSLLSKERQYILGSKLSNTTLNSPDLSAPTSARVREIQKFLDASKQIQVLKTQLQSLRQTENILKQQVKKFPALIRQKDDLERQLRITVDNLNHFLGERERLRIDSAQRQVPWQILTPPDNPQNVAPSIKLNLVLGTILGLLLSTAYALLIDKFNNVFYNLEEIKEQTTLPVLGEIPYIKQGINFLSLQKYHVWDFWESLHSIYTNICLLNSDHAIRSLAIISATHGDGKSTIALYLAQTAAAMGKRVLLVDANLRNPSIHKILDLSNAQGFSDLIAKDVNFENVIHQTSENNLCILTSGSACQNYTMFFSSSKIQDLLEKFKHNFDLIIYDTSHLIGCADASLITRHTDASLLALRLGKTKRSLVVQVLEQLNFSSTLILGAIAVNIEKQN